MRTNNRQRMLVIFASVLALASQAAAHPGHGLGGGSAHALHYLTDPMHVAPIAAGVLALALAVRARRSAGARKR